MAYMSNLNPVPLKVAGRQKYNARIRWNMANQLQNVDHSAIRTNQATIIILLVLAFVLNLPWLVGLVALVMLAGTFVRRPGFAMLLYARWLKPLGWVKPYVLKDNPEPHLFAQGFGGIVLVVSSLGFALGSAVVGWIMAWLVIALAALNLFGGFCVGCAVYYWLNRMNVPGFIKSPPEGTFPGMRPRQGSHAD